VRGYIARTLPAEDGIVAELLDQLRVFRRISVQGWLISEMPICRKKSLLKGLFVRPPSLEDAQTVYDDLETRIWPWFNCR
jgi:hypothetical protein